jgi:hypothetical protein
LFPPSGEWAWGGWDEGLICGVDADADVGSDGGVVPVGLGVAPGVGVCVGDDPASMLELLPPPVWPPPPPMPPPPPPWACCAAFISFLYLLLRFWNQIFTCKETNVEFQGEIHFFIQVQHCKLKYAKLLKYAQYAYLISYVLLIIYRNFQMEIYDPNIVFKK